MGVLRTQEQAVLSLTRRCHDDVASHGLEILFSCSAIGWRVMNLAPTHSSIWQTLLGQIAEHNGCGPTLVLVGSADEQHEPQGGQTGGEALSHAVNLDGQLSRWRDHDGLDIMRLRFSCGHK